MQWESLNLSVVACSQSVSEPVLFGWRLMACLYANYCTISHFLEFGTNEEVRNALHWFVYLTHWNALNVMIYVNLALVVTVLVHKDPPSAAAPLLSSKLGILSHLFFELSSLTATVVALLYWVALYPTENPHPQEYDAFLNVTVHGIYALMMLVELFLSSQVLVQFHLIGMLFYTLAYLIVNAIETLLDRPVYNILTYKSPVTVMWIAIAFGLMLFWWLVVYLLIRLRARLCSRKRALSVVVFSKEQPAASTPASVPV